MEAMVNNFIKALGWSIFHSLWQGALIYILLFFILIAIPRLNAKVKHNLSFGSLLLMFISFCFTFYSVFEWPLSNVGKANTMAFIAQVSLHDLSLLGSNSFLKAETWFPMITSLYIFGIGVQLILLLSGYQKLKTLKKSNTVPIPAEWNVVFQAILVQLKINKPINFYLSAKVNVPLVIGYFKPVVLFPIALAAQLDLKQVEAILIHELSHIRRNDYALNLIKTVIETLLFFNPFIWLAGKFIRIEREHACDDLVVKHTGTPLTYAHALLKLELLKDKQAPTLSLAATGTNQHLYQRIKRITNMKTSYINAKQQMIILALTLSTVLSLAWMNPKKPAVKKAKNIATLTNRVVEAKPISTPISVKADTDTTKKKKIVKSKIIITDDNGSTKTYNSIKELPDSIRAVVIKSQFVGDSIAKYFSSKEWNENIEKIKENALVIAKKHDSKEWKDHIAKMQENALAIAKKYESKEWKESIAKAQQNALLLQKKYESKEWKDHLSRIKQNALEIEKKYNSPEWKQKIEELKKLQDSPEYKELKKKFDKDIEELKKQKGIKTDKAVLRLNLDRSLEAIINPGTDSRVVVRYENFY